MEHGVFVLYSWVAFCILYIIQRIEHEYTATKNRHNLNNIFRYQMLKYSFRSTLPEKLTKINVDMTRSFITFFIQPFLYSFFYFVCVLTYAHRKPW